MRTGTTAIECYRIGPRWYRPVDSASGQSRLAARCPCAPWIFRGLGDEYGGAAGEIFFGCRVQLNIAHSRLTSGSDVAKSMPGPAHAADPPFVITQRLHIHTGSISYFAATERALAHGASRWARIVNAFAFDPDNSSALRILLPRGPVDRRLARWAVHWPMRPSPVAAEIGGGVRRATAHSDRRSKGPRLDEAAIGREQKGLDNDNRRNIRGGFEQDC
jgi:hypothetical protein